MPATFRHKTLFVGAASAVLACVSGPVTAQDAAGLEANLTFSQGLTYSDRDGTFGRTNLGFGISSETRTQTFEFDISAALEQDFDSGLSTDIIDPRVALTYGIESRQTAVTTNVSYRQSDVDTTDDILGVLVIDDGTQENISAAVQASFGREAPFGATVDLGYSDVGYTNTTSATLIDTDTTTYGFDLRFDVDRRITATLGYDWSDTDRAIGRDVLTERLTAGAQLAVTPTLDANVSVGVSKTTITNGPFVSNSNGLTYALSLTQARPTGELRASLNSNVTESGRRTTALVGGTFELPRGEVSGEFGLTEGSNNTIRPLLTLGYTEELPRGSYSVSLNQGFETTTSGDEALNSRLRLTWRQDLTRTARMSSDLTYQITDILGANDDSSKLVLGLRYTQDLTQDWSITTRYTHSVSDSDTTSTSRENQLFVGLETSLGWRP